MGPSNGTFGSACVSFDMHRSPRSNSGETIRKMGIYSCHGWVRLAVENVFFSPWLYIRRMDHDRLRWDNPVSNITACGSDILL